MDKEISCLCDSFSYRNGHQGSGYYRECKGRSCKCGCNVV